MSDLDLPMHVEDCPPTTLAPFREAVTLAQAQAVLALRRVELLIDGEYTDSERLNEDLALLGPAIARIEYYLAAEPDLSPAQAARHRKLIEIATPARCALATLERTRARLRARELAELQESGAVVTLRPLSLSS
jgi:hypothetical protein